MGQNKDTNFGEINKLALIAESVQNLFKGKGTIIFELQKEEYSNIISHFREIDRHHKQFTIEISGMDFVFILDEPQEEKL